MNANLQLAIWVLGTLLIGLAVRHIAHNSGAGQLAHLAQATAAGHLLSEVVSFLFHVGIPFVALIVGALGLDHMMLGQAQPNTLLGFTALSWLRSTGIALGTTLLVLAVMWLMAHPRPAPAGEGSGVRAILPALYAEVHWAFYRSLGSQLFSDPYWGAVLGFGLIGLEWVLHPNFRTQAQSAQGRASMALQLICLITSSALYLGAQNLWLSIAAQTVLLAAGERWFVSHAPIQNTKPA
jgi:hypothetical protein